jgi:hypothetical protein
VGAVQNVLFDHLFDSTLHIKDAKILWDNLNVTYGASDATVSCTSWRAFMITRWLETDL